MIVSVFVVVHLLASVDVPNRRFLLRRGRCNQPWNAVNDLAFVIKAEVDHRDTEHTEFSNSISVHSVSLWFFSFDPGQTAFLSFASGLALLVRHNYVLAGTQAFISFDNHLLTGLQLTNDLDPTCFRQP